MNRFIERLHLDRYVNSRLILGLDVAASSISSLAAMVAGKTVFAGVLPLGVLSPWWLAGSVLVSAVVFCALRTHRIVIRHSTLRDLLKFVCAVAAKFLLLWGLLAAVTHAHAAPLGGRLPLLLFADAALTFVVLVVMRVGMVVVYDEILKRGHAQKNRMNILVYGTGDKSVALLTRLQNSTHYNVMGITAYSGDSRGLKITGTEIYTFSDERSFLRLRDKRFVEAVLFATDGDMYTEQERLIRYCLDSGTKVMVAPSIEVTDDGKPLRTQIRDVKIEDLLGRPEIRISVDDIRREVEGKTILVTGAAGSIGSELCRQLAGFGVGRLVLFDNAETPMHNLRLELEERFPDLKFVPVIGDVRLLNRLDYAFGMWKPQIVFHAAAYKHVPLMEDNPCEAVLVNLTGSRNVADKCIKYGVEKMVMISTDKAVNPTNVMGCTKRLAEIYVQSLGLAMEKGEIEGRTRFVTTRFGNVLGSNGSVIPRFREQIEKGGPVTVTHPEINRYFMTIPEACRLVMEAATMTTGNQIFVFDMGKPVRIADLARRMIELAGFVPGKDIEIVYTGLRPGEKLYEEVLADSENTLPTSHDRIRIAKVREYAYEDALAAANRLEILSRKVDVMGTVRKMKETVPEFKSRNSRFEVLDRKEA